MNKKALEKMYYIQHIPVASVKKEKILKSKIFTEV